MKITKKDTLFFVRIIGVLLVITMCVAALLALVNEVTKDRIAKIERAELESAVKRLFPNTASPTSAELNVDIGDETLSSFNSVSDGQSLVGYYAKVSPKGFKGAVVMLVGLNTDGTICGIEIISSGETPGIGDKIESDDFLGKFNGKTDKTLDVDAIGGATYSSKAVINGTKTALKAYNKYMGVA